MNRSRVAFTVTDSMTGERRRNLLSYLRLQLVSRINNVMTFSDAFSEAMAEPLMC